MAASSLPMPPTRADADARGGGGGGAATATTATAAALPLPYPPTDGHLRVFLDTPAGGGSTKRGKTMRICEVFREAPSNRCQREGELTCMLPDGIPFYFCAGHRCPRCTDGVARPVRSGYKESNTCMACVLIARRTAAIKAAETVRAVTTTSRPQCDVDGCNRPVIANKNVAGTLSRYCNLHRTAASRGEAPQHQPTPTPTTPDRAILPLPIPPPRPPTTKPAAMEDAMDVDDPPSSGPSSISPSSSDDEGGEGEVEKKQDKEKEAAAVAPSITSVPRNRFYAQIRAMATAAEDAEVAKWEVALVAAIMKVASLKKLTFDWRGLREGAAMPTPNMIARIRRILEYDMGFEVTPHYADGQRSSPAAAASEGGEEEEEEEESDSAQQTTKKTADTSPIGFVVCWDDPRSCDYKGGVGGQGPCDQPFAGRDLKADKDYCARHCCSNCKDALAVTGPSSPLLCGACAAVLRLPLQPARSSLHLLPDELSSTTGEAPVPRTSATDVAETAHTAVSNKRKRDAALAERLEELSAAKRARTQ